MNCFACFSRFLLPVLFFSSFALMHFNAYTITCNMKYTTMLIYCIQIRWRFIILKISSSESKNYKYKLRTTIIKCHNTMQSNRFENQWIQKPWFLTIDAVFILIGILFHWITTMVCVCCSSGNIEKDQLTPNNQGERNKHSRYSAIVCERERDTHSLMICKIKSAKVIWLHIVKEHDRSKFTK